MSAVRYSRSFGFRNQMPAFGAPAFDASGQHQRAERRVRRILASIARDVGEGGTARVRQILRVPHELYRIEVERPDMSYVRTTVLGREALTTLLEETPENLVRERFIFRSPS